MSKLDRSPIGGRIREARKASGFTQEKLGIEAGIDETVASARMSQYENNVHTPDFQFVKKLSELLNVPTAYFYAEEDELAELISKFEPSINLE